MTRFCLAAALFLSAFFAIPAKAETNIMAQNQNDWPEVAVTAMPVRMIEQDPKTDLLRIKSASVDWKVGLEPLNAVKQDWNLIATDKVRPWKKAGAALLTPGDLLPVFKIAAVDWKVGLLK